MIRTVYVLDGGLSADHCERLERVITKVRPDSSIVWCRISNSDLAGLPVEGYLSKSAYLRLFCTSVQERSKRIVYVDCDLLVVRDLSGVLDLDFGDYPIAAVRDFIFDDIAQLPKPLPEEQCVPWDGAARCFNSGVLVIDCARYAALAVEERRSLMESGLVEIPRSAATRICLIRCWRVGGSSSPTPTISSRNYYT